MGTPSYAYNEDRMMAGIAIYLAEVKQIKRVAPAKRIGVVPAVEQEKTVVMWPVVVCDHTPVSRELIKSVAAKFSLTPRQLLSSSHEKHLVVARSAIVLILRQEHGYSLTRIGNILNRHHTTIMYSEQMAKKHYEESQAFREIVDSLSKTVRPVKRDELGIPL